MTGRRGASAALAAIAVAIAASVFSAARAEPLSDAAAPQGRAAAEHPKAPPRSSDFDREMASSMQQMMQDMHAPGSTGNADIDFLAMMIPHHAGAVDMARLVLRHGRDPATRQLAEDIIASQTIEIESMQRRLETLRRGNAAVGAGAFPALGGTRGP